MDNGYGQFFKQARKANEKKGGAGSSKSSKGRSASGVKFTLSGGARARSREMDPAMSAQSQALSPEEHLRLELARRMKAKKREIVRKRQKFPVFPFACMTFALVAGGVGYMHPEFADSALSYVHQHVDIGVFGRAAAAEKTAEKPAEKTVAKGEAGKTEEKAAGTGAAHGENASEAKAEGKDEKVANIRGWTPEELSFFNKLNDRKKELDLREAELNKLEEELQKQKAALDEKIKQLETMRVQISQTLKTRVANDQQKVDKLVDFYSTMKPQQAAKVIETLNEDLAVEVLDKMKKKNAAEIMNALDAKKARRLSELLTGYQRTPASATNEAADGAGTSDSTAN
jgi:flagellar motility protein MotE (MotC chaperone)